jgi:hypothetical protein
MFSQTIYKYRLFDEKCVIENLKLYEKKNIILNNRYDYLKSIYLKLSFQKYEEFTNIINFIVDIPQLESIKTNIVTDICRNQNF